MHPIEPPSGEGPRPWGEQHAAWQHGTAPRTSKEPLPLGVLVQVCAHRLAALGPGPRLAFGTPRPHARDAAGCNWTIDTLRGGAALDDAGAQRVLAQLRGEFDLVA